MESRFVRVGNTQALVIPAAIMREHDWAVGDTVELQSMANGIIALDTSKHKTIVAIGRRIVRDNLNALRRLAKL